MSELKGKFRRRRTNFAAVSNDALRDSGLSLRAKGLYSMIQSYINIPGYDLYKGYLMRVCKEKERAFNSAWQELKERGYLKQYRMPGKRRGQFTYEYDLLEIADQLLPSTINLNAKGERAEQGEKGDLTAAGQPVCEKAQRAAEADHTLQNVPYGQEVRKTGRNGADHTLHFAPYAPSTVCSEHPVLGAPHAERGDRNNTQTNKTESNKNGCNYTPSVSQSQPDPVRQTDGQTDEIRKKLLEQINFDWIAETHPDDVPAADTLLDCMVEMLSVPFTKIRGVSQSRYAIQKRLEKVDEEDVVGFLAHMREREIAPKNIRDISAYWKSAFINYIGEQDLAASAF